MGSRRRQGAAEVPRVAFQQCPGCDYELVAGTGTRSCGWYDCPYLPEELKVNCLDCNYNVAIGDGAPSCGEPPSCRWAAEGRRYAEHALESQAQQRQTG